MSAKKENPDNYIGRTEEGIRRMKERAYAKIGDPKYHARRRELHRKNPLVRLRGGGKDRCREKEWFFYIPTYKDMPPMPKNCSINNSPLIVGDKFSTNDSPTLDRIDNKPYYVSVRLKQNNNVPSEIENIPNNIYKNLHILHSDKEYIWIGNVQIISRKANQMKSDATFREIEKLYLWAKKNNKKGILL